MVTNIVKATFGTSRSVRTRPLYQWDYGQVLQFELDLPVAYEVHFSNEAIGNVRTTSPMLSVRLIMIRCWLISFLLSFRVTCCIS